MHCHSMEIWEYTIGVYANLSALFAYRLISVFRRRGVMHPVKSSTKPGAGFIEVSDIAIFNQLLDHLHDRADLFGTLPDHGNNRPW